TPTSPWYHPFVRAPPPSASHQGAQPSWMKCGVLSGPKLPSAGCGMPLIIARAEWSCTCSMRINRIGLSVAENRENFSLTLDPRAPHLVYSRFTGGGDTGGLSQLAQPRERHCHPWLTASLAEATAGRETGVPPARTTLDRSARPPSPAYKGTTVWLS